ncbi:MAG: hypothetical protein WC975_08710 [Phycisphaerae bacterium]
MKSFVVIVRLDRTIQILGQGKMLVDAMKGTPYNNGTMLGSVAWHDYLGNLGLGI